MKTENKIPKIIHYCWFGKKERPGIIKRCIESWNENLSEYQIQEWNEDTFDINVNSYVKEAYNSKRFAFVSDFVRLYALYNFGGIYLDTDVEVIKPFDDLLHHDSFWGFEQANFIATSTIGAAKGNEVIKVFLDSYKDKKFIEEDGSYDSLTNVVVITKILQEIGISTNGEFQEIEGVCTIYPQTYFSPYDYINCREFNSESTYAIHHFYKSWLPYKTRIKTKIKKFLSLIIGGGNIHRIRMIIYKTSKRDI